MADCSYYPQVYTSWDMDQLLAEIQKAQSLLGHIQALCQKTPCEELTGMMKEVGGVGKDSGAGSLPSSFPTCFSENVVAKTPVCSQRNKAKPCPSLYPAALGGPSPVLEGS